MKTLEDYMAEISSLETGLTDIDTKLAQIRTRLEEALAKKNAIDEAHRLAVEKYTQGNATDADVQAAASKLGSMDGAIRALEATVSAIEAEREKLEIQLIRVEKLAEKAHEEARYMEASRIIQESEAALEDLLKKVFVAAMAGNHSMALPDNLLHWVNGVARRASTEVDRGNAPTPADIGMTLPGPFSRSFMVSPERRQELSKKAA